MTVQKPVLSATQIRRLVLQAAAMGATVHIRPDGTILVHPEAMKPDDEFSDVNMKK